VAETCLVTTGYNSRNEAPAAVDARVIALAERLRLHQVAALDRRDFQVVAPRHLPKGERLKLLPED
jgi:hypothetical protein